MQEPPKKPILKKPPGYKDSNSATHPTKPIAKKSPLPPSLQNNKKRLPLQQHRRQQPRLPTRRRRRTWYRTFCCCIFITLFLIMLTLGITTAIFYIWFTPKLPIFQLKPVTIDRFNISLTDGMSYLNSRATVWLQVRNPNSRVTVYYGEMEATLLTEEETELGYARKMGFRQGTGNVTVLKFGVRVDKMEIDVGSVGRLKERVKGRVVKVRVEVKTRIGFGVAGKKGRIGMLPIGVNCGGKDGISLKRLGEGGRPPKCKIDLFRWMKING